MLIMENTEGHDFGIEVDHLKKHLYRGDVKDGDVISINNKPVTFLHVESFLN